jgi:mono/diheme cytochrome c family protein
MWSSEFGGATMRAVFQILVSLSVALCLLMAGCKVSPPGALERSVASQLKRRVTVGGKSDKNPFPSTEANIKSGEQEFQNYCTSCHGPDGRNTGVIFADKMAPPVPLLDSSEVQQFSDGQLRWVIENGIFPSGMPAWKDNLQDEQIWRIVLYIRHLPKK